MQGERFHQQTGSDEKVYQPIVTDAQSEVGQKISRMLLQILIMNLINFLKVMMRLSLVLDT